MAPGGERIFAVPWNEDEPIDTARQSRNRRREGLTAEYAEYAEGEPEPGLLSAYSAYSAVYLILRNSSPPANHLTYMRRMSPYAAFITVGSTRHTEG